PLPTASGQSADAVIAEPLQRNAPPAETGIEAISSLSASVSAVASVTGTGSIQLPNADKAAASSGGKTAVSGIARPALRAGRSNTVQPGVGVASVGASAVADSAALLRLQTESQGAGAVAREAVGKPLIAVKSDAAETFAAMDAQEAPGRPSWIQAGRQQAEAGFQDPELGWVGVRADASGSGIHAQLLAGSANAAQALSGQMAGLNAFLVEHHTPVETLTLNTASGSGTGFANDPGTGGEMRQGTGEQAGQQSPQGAGSLPSSRVQLSGAALPEPVWPAGLDESAQRVQWVGGHISVMA
ncbi:MAG: hypothetical protein WAN35_09960, partial [Terracidiphilus sp.]